MRLIVQCSVSSAQTIVRIQKLSLTPLHPDSANLIWFFGKSCMRDVPTKTAVITLGSKWEEAVKTGPKLRGQSISVGDSHTPSLQGTIPSPAVTRIKAFSSSPPSGSRCRSKCSRWLGYIGLIRTRISSLLVRLSFQLQPNTSIIYAGVSLPVTVVWLLPQINMVVNF